MSLLVVEGLQKEYAGNRPAPFAPPSAVRVVVGVDFTVEAGETLGLVGESGCGKSTTARCLIGLEKPTAGRILFDGIDVGNANARQLRELRRQMQYVFQDPFASLNPLMTAEQTLSEPLMLAGLPRRRVRERVAELLGLVGLGTEHLGRFPHEFSGGQRQRIGIARALALEPRLIILDEPVSALDVSIQAQVINLLEDLQKRLGLAYLFVAHDLSVVSHISRRVAVMYLGRIVEIGPREQVFDTPAHPYTKALLSAVPIDDPDKRATNRRIVLKGELPSPANPPSGCRFRTRCWKVQPLCETEEPQLVELGGGRRAACHFPETAEVAT